MWLLFVCFLTCLSRSTAWGLNMFLESGYMAEVSMSFGGRSGWWAAGVCR